MAKKPVIGYMQCPDCDFPDAEVREDKHSLAYRYCPECNLQTFTREPVKDARMRARMRANVSTPGASVDASGAETPHVAEPSAVDAPEAAPAPAQAFIPGTPAKPRRVGLLLDD
ncbi:MAG: hypothetical protein ACK52V_16120 [Betaproteobacteria bacterium]|jgi:hypothetical protein